VLNTGSRVAILAGQGALGAAQELEQVADLLGAPVAKALLGKRSCRILIRTSLAASAISARVRRSRCWRRATRF